MKSKLKIRRCKNKACNMRFQQTQPLQYVCCWKCGIDYAKLLKANKEAKELNDKVASWKPNTHAKEHKKALQDNVNKLSRMIDSPFYDSCIDCGKPYGKQTDAAHFHSRGANCSLRYNLHNLHSASSQCNQWSDKHKEGYKIGLVSRYGQDYLTLVENLPLKYPEIHLSNIEIVEKLTIVRKLIRDFKTFNFTNGVSAREVLNRLINIYN